jgi:signal transduction histidine kinase
VPKGIFLVFHYKENKQIIQWNGEEAVVLSVAMANGQRMEIYSLFSAVDRKLFSIMSILVASSSLLLILVVFGGALMNSIAFRPIQKIIREVQEFNPAHPSHRLEVPDTGDEIASLSQVINRLLDRIYELIQKQNRFVGDASHELRTPIAVIRGYLDLLRRWGMKKPEVAQEAMEMMDQELKRIEKMTKQLLQLARFDSKEVETEERETFSVNQIVEERVRCWRRVIKEVTIDAHVPKMSILMEGDKTDFVELLDILLDNAGKYTKKGGQIVVSLEMKKKEMKLSVRDTGQGIPEEDLPHVFERFYRVKKVRSTQPGSGLGLSIAQQIVQKYNGRLEITSKVGKGTTISAFFPNSHQILI